MNTESKSAEDRRLRRNARKLITNRAWLAANPTKVWLYALAEQYSRYGLSREEFNELILKQAGCCAICDKFLSLDKEGLHIDHDHQTGEVRGLLCANCNRGLGMFQDKPKLLNTAAEYLVKHGHSA